MQAKNTRVCTWMLWIVFLQVMTNMFILLNISIVRYFVGFLFFTFIPGYLIVRALELYRLDELECILFSLGFSITFLMLVGLVGNIFGRLFGIIQPLSLSFILPIINFFTLIGIILSYKKGKNNVQFNFEYFRPYLLALAALLSVFPFLSVVGAIWVGFNGSNVLLLALIILISLIFIIAITLKGGLIPKFYPIIIFSFALALLYHATFISSYPISYGGDLARELFIFKNTLSKELWETGNPYNDVRYGRLQSMLSITILPTVYSNLLGLQSDVVLKIIYPTIFAFVPLGLYVIWREKVGRKPAFISTFLFMTFATFFTEIFGLNRQMIAELFFVLLLFTILNDRMKNHARMICFIIFGFALIISHYGIAEIFMVFIFFAFLLLLMRKSLSTRITLRMCVLFFVIMFAWYIYTANGATFESFVGYGDYVYRSLSDIFELEARETEVLRGLGLETPPTVWNALSRGFQYIVQFLIVIGFIAVVIGKKRIAVKLDKESMILIVVAMVFLGLLLVVPGLSRTMNITRFFHILLFIISPLCVIGVNFLVSFSKKNRELLSSLLLIVVLVPYFLFQSGFIYEVVGNDTWCLPLSAYRMPAYRSRGQLGLVDERDIVGALWLKSNLNVYEVTVCGDNPSVSYALFAYSMILKEKMVVLSNVTIITKNSVLYLSRLNTIDNTIVGNNFIWNATYFPFPDDLSTIYTNGASEIYVK